MSNKDVAMIEYPITINPHRQGNKDRVFHIEHPRQGNVCCTVKLNSKPHKKQLTYKKNKIKIITTRSPAFPTQSRIQSNSSLSTWPSNIPHIINLLHCKGLIASFLFAPYSPLTTTSVTLPSPTFNSLKTFLSYSNSYSIHNPSLSNCLTYRQFFHKYSI